MLLGHRGSTSAVPDVAGPTIRAGSFPQQAVVEHDLHGRWKGLDARPVALSRRPSRAAKAMQASVHSAQKMSLRRPFIRIFMPLGAAFSAYVGPCEVC